MLRLDRSFRSPRQTSIPGCQRNQKMPIFLSDIPRIPVVLRPGSSLRAFSTTAIARGVRSRRSSKLVNCAEPPERAGLAHGTSSSPRPPSSPEIVRRLKNAVPDTPARSIKTLIGQPLFCLERRRCRGTGRVHGLPDSGLSWRRTAAMVPVLAIRNEVDLPCSIDWIIASSLLPLSSGLLPGQPSEGTGQQPSAVPARRV